MGKLSGWEIFRILLCTQCNYYYLGLFPILPHQYPQWLGTSEFCYCCCWPAPLLSEGETFWVFQFSCLGQPNEDTGKVSPQNTSLALKITSHLFIRGRWMQFLFIPIHTLSVVITRLLHQTHLNNSPLVANLPSGLYYEPKHKIWNSLKDTISNHWTSYTISKNTPIEFTLTFFGNQTAR